MAVRQHGDSAKRPYRTSVQLPIGILPYDDLTPSAHGVRAMMSYDAWADLGAPAMMMWRYDIAIVWRNGSFTIVAYCNIAIW